MTVPADRRPEQWCATRVLIASDVRLYRDGLIWGLAGNGHLEIAGTADEPALALHRVHDTHPHVLLVDMAMADALDLIRAVAASAPATKVVAFAVAEDQGAIMGCIEAGVAGYVLRGASLDELVATVEAAVRGESQCSPQLVACLFRRVAALAGERAGPGTEVVLTQREREIATLVDEGLSNKEIASRLGIELATVKNHVHNLLEKLQIHRRSQVGARLGLGRGRRTLARSAG